MRAPTLGWLPTVPALLQRAARRFGSKDLVVAPGRRLSFADAERESGELARVLLAAGVGKGTRVGLMLPSSPDWVIAWLALARVGALSMLFSTTYRSLEITKALRHGDAALLIAPARLLGRDLAVELAEALPGLAEGSPGRHRLLTAPHLRDVWLLGGPGEHGWARDVQLDPVAVPQGGGAVSEELLAAVEAQVTPSDLLTVVYTSGSSADPKAVMHTHGAAVRKVAPEVGLGLWSSRPGRVFLAMPMFWVGGPQSVLGALHAGSTILCQEKFDVGEALDLIERERATAIGGWPTLLDALQGDPSAAGRDLNSLEPPEPPPPPGTPGALVSSRGDPQNVGMTETFGPHRDRAWFDYEVIDPETGEGLPEGVEGEFCVRGFGLMSGLYKREREEVFDPDGFYHTGDRGYLEHSVVYFTGRYSEMIKTGGANVAPQEVEGALLALDEVKQAYVFGLPDPSRGEVVAAVLVAADGGPLDPADVQRRLRRLLSGYKVPSRVRVIGEDDVPYLGSGKPDKRAMRRSWPDGDDRS